MSKGPSKVWCSHWEIPAEGKYLLPSSGRKGQELSTVISFPIQDSTPDCRSLAQGKTSLPPLQPFSTGLALLSPPNPPRLQLSLEAHAALCAVGLRQTALWQPLGVHRLRSGSPLKRQGEPRPPQSESRQSKAAATAKSWEEGLSLLFDRPAWEALTDWSR